MAILTEADVEGLLRAPTPESRAEAARKIGAVHAQNELTPKERALAESIFRIMVRDTDVRVRQALAEQLKTNALVPHDVALTLARDVEAVALPMLHYSLVLTDADLIEIVRTRSSTYQMVVAGRERVSEAVAEAIADHGTDEVVGTLTKNPGAEITDRVGAKIIELFSGSEVVMDGLAVRPTLPLRLAERLVTLVSENIRLQLAESHGILDAVSEQVIKLGRERAALDIVRPDASDAEIEAFVHGLLIKGRLTPSMVARMLCTGRILAAEAALARLCGVPRANAHALIHDSGPLGLRSVIRASGLPEGMNELLRTTLALARGHAGQATLRDPRAFAADVVAHLAGRVGGEAPRDLEALIAGLDRTDYVLRIERALAPAAV
ncbi:MAG: DUF2336 domain-containing protein [Alphaproteobacteria bacterium]